MSTTRSRGLLWFLCAGLMSSAALAQDAGAPLDAGLALDAGPGVDAGEPLPDDAGEPLPDDAGEPLPDDAGEPLPVDAGVSLSDAGDPPPPDDAGEPPPEDAGEPPICTPGCQDATTLIACGAAGAVEIPCSSGFICQIDSCVIGSLPDGGPGPVPDGGVTGDGGGRPGPDPCEATCLDDRRIGVCSASGQVTPVPCATNESCDNGACRTAAEDGLGMLGCNCGSSGAEGVVWSLAGLLALLFWRRRGVVPRRARQKRETGARM